YTLTHDLPTIYREAAKCRVRCFIHVVSIGSWRLDSRNWPSSMSTASLPKVPLAKDLGAMGPLDLIAGDDFPGLTRDSGFNRHVEPTIQAVMAGLKDSVRKDLRRLLEAEPGVRIAVE